MHIKIFTSIVTCFIIIQLSMARNVRHDKIIERRLLETRRTLDTIRNRQSAIVVPLEDAFMRNFTAIIEHGDFVTSYLVRNAHFVIENIEFEASKQGIRVDACVEMIIQLMSSLVKQAADDINATKHDFNALYRRMFEHLMQKSNRIEKELRDSEILLVDCHLDGGCFEMVFSQIDKIEKYINAAFVNDFKLQIEGFMLKMQQQYHAIKGFYLSLYENIRSSEEEFRKCCEEQFRI